MPCLWQEAIVLLVVPLRFYDMLGLYGGKFLGYDL